MESTPFHDQPLRTGSQRWIPPGPPASSDRMVRLLWWLSLGGGILYLLLGAALSGPLRVTVKALGVGMLAGLVFRVAGSLIRPVDGWILAVALTFSCFGDIFLALGGGRNFLYGLSSFLVTHLLYLWLFLRHWQRPLRPARGRLLISILVLAFSLFFSQWLSPALGDLAVPVTLYICAITLMVVASLWSTLSHPWIWLGALLFLASDAILAADRFRTDVPLAGFWIWATYYLGQYGIALGILADGWPETKREAA
jgi:uncharacterized membrane protein YhhN